MRLLSAIALLLLACSTSTDPEPPSLAGRWEGINYNAYPPHHWRLDLDDQPEGRVTGTFDLTSATGLPAHGTIEGSHRRSHVVLYASGTSREISCVIQGVSTGGVLNTDIDCGWRVVPPVAFWRVR